MLDSNVVIQTAFLGDLLLAIPVLKTIKKKFPEQELILVCKKNIGDFFLNEKLVDSVIEVEKSNAQSYTQALNFLKNKNINQVFCLHKSARSLFFTSKIKAQKKIGFHSLLGFWVFDEHIEFVKKNPEVLRQLKIVEGIDSDIFNKLNESEYVSLNTKLPDGSLTEIPEYFLFNSLEKVNLKNKRVAIFPGSVWATKKWTKEGFINLISLLVKNSYSVDLLGGLSEKPLCLEIAAQFTNVKVIAGDLTITETIKSLNQYQIVVTNDSAPTHMAAYMQVPVITVFGPTTLNMGFRPWSNNSFVVENNNINCRPCGKHGHNVCPRVHHDCMKLITASEVFQLINS